MTRNTTMGDVMARRFYAYLLVVFLAACNNSGEKGATETSSKPAGEPPAATQTTGTLIWEAPHGWVEEEPASGMRQRQYRLPSPFDDGADATAAVFHFQGTGGDVSSNLQRWYAQFEQPDGGSSADAARVLNAIYHGLRHTLVDLKGTYLYRENMMGPVTEKRPKYRMLASVIEAPSGLWFVKVLGPEATVDYWQTSFYEFMSTFEERP